jgi:hypothetical protein
MRDSERRVAALARAIYGEEAAVLRDATSPPFARFAAIGLVGLLSVGAIAGLAVFAANGSRSTHPGLPRVERLAAPPLELVALEHDRDDDRLVVRGIVRNPSSAATRSNLAAVVLIYAREGSLIASGRAPVAVKTLAPGAETAFVVTLPDAESVDRYRVSFRTEDRIVPHVDRRARSALARKE